MDKRLNGSKPAITSLTILGGGIASIAGIVDVIQKVADSGVLPPQVTPYLALIGGLLSIFGRVKAKSSISGLVRTK